MKTSPICLALDNQNLDESIQLLEKVRPYIGMIKIGPIMYFSNGLKSLELGKNFNLPVFLDLKLHDIPKTVSKTLKILLNQFEKINGNHHIISIHTSGSFDMCKAAKDTVLGTNVDIAGVTVLSSLNRHDLSSYLNFRRPTPSLKVLDLMSCGEKAGLTTFVCSPSALRMVKKDHPKNQIICAGIRSSNDDDHKQSKPFSFALKEGGDIFVIGKPITENSDPEKAAINFYNTWEKFAQTTQGKI